MTEKLLDAIAGAFRNAWGNAHRSGFRGTRTLAGLDAALPIALLAYSEWLDGQGLVEDLSACNDHRTHEELVGAFLKGAN